MIHGVTLLGLVMPGETVPVQGPAGPVHVSGEPAAPLVVFRVDGWEPDPEGGPYGPDEAQGHRVIRLMEEVGPPWQDRIDAPTWPAWRWPCSSPAARRRSWSVASRSSRPRRTTSESTPRRRYPSPHIISAVAHPPRLTHDHPPDKSPSPMTGKGLSFVMKRRAPRPAEGASPLGAPAPGAGEVSERRSRPDQRRVATSLRHRQRPLEESARRRGPPGVAGADKKPPWDKPRGASLRQAAFWWTANRDPLAAIRKRRISG